MYAQFQRLQESIYTQTFQPYACPKQDVAHVDTMWHLFAPNVSIPFTTGPKSFSFLKIILFRAAVAYFISVEVSFTNLNQTTEE
jgi:RNAse (barnase) inhibitor barstar